jgi:hypothetical protein
MPDSPTDARRQSLERLIVAAESLLSNIEDHVGEFGETPLYDDQETPTAEGSARHQLRGSVLFCLRKAKAKAV